MVPLSNSMPTMATQVLSGMHSTRGMESALAENSVRDAYRRHVGGNDGAQDVTANKGQRPVEGDCPICFDELVAGQVGRISEPPAPCTGHAFLGRLKHWQEETLVSVHISCRQAKFLAGSHLLWPGSRMLWCSARPAVTMCIVSASVAGVHRSEGVPNPSPAFTAGLVGLWKMPEIGPMDCTRT